ncbi:antibiotic biosynthesis monooxygenase [Colwellia sp. 1_MG-2023]|uniref:putative quinol monooxygenase n=1 Tax=Colwellia sp. 1_MG-2023 TaxID=3062649 RepID=UPI0026E30A94|nr:antibiotic biosynthesis monooxygenase [Colwellia sp. 1_MG-2023]MDO6445420.1 antibiotic biosynthesis monooxygenase [Colwellia sp. 1_MG-2023]
MNKNKSQVIGVVFALISMFSLYTFAEPVSNQIPSKNLGFLVTLKAKPGKEADVGQLISNAIILAEKEEQTLTWYAFQIDESTFGIFDTFHDEEGRQVHLNGDIAKLLMANAEELLMEKPTIKPIGILSNK